MRPFDILDVFTATPLAGNPLAVVHEADGLSDDRMQAIAGEFNLSETIFLHAARDGAVPARIFTPRTELPFAGHPTVGGAIAHALRHGVSEVRLSVPAGPVRVAIGGGAVRRATLDAPLLPELAALDIAAADLAALTGIDAADIATADIATGAYRPVRMTSGPWFTAIPLRRAEALAGARFEMARAEVLGDAPRSVYLVAREGEGFRARMFAPFSGIAEDPATGSAAVAFAALFAAAERPGDGLHEVTIRQGVEMGRPSVLRLGVEIAGGAIARVSLSGEAVPVASGTLLA